MAHAKHKERQEARPSGGREKEKRNPSADAFTGCSGAEDVGDASSAGLSEREAGELKQSLQDVERGGACESGEAVAHASGQRLQGSEEAGDNGEDWPELGDKQPSRFGGVQGSQWEIEPNVGRVANGIPSRTHRLKSLGNAIVPQVAFEILKLLNPKKENKHG
jgi:DNA (cytosine-5)-methyltransferase 1